MAPPRQRSKLLCNEVGGGNEAGLPEVAYGLGVGAWARSVELQGRCGSYKEREGEGIEHAPLRSACRPVSDARPVASAGRLANADCESGGGSAKEVTVMPSCLHCLPMLLDVLFETGALSPGNHGQASLM